jgi:hypothetical protein
MVSSKAGTKFAVARFRVRSSSRTRKFMVDLGVPVAGISWLYILWHLLPILIGLMA